ncbi:MAG TPA: NUDIX domain-containing protein [Candidatus Paceibacterota bacterium]
MIKHSAGVLVYRKHNSVIEYFLVHPGGPYWSNKDKGIWGIPKGEIHDGEGMFETAQREFTEETGFTVEGNFTPLGSVKKKDGKIIHGWAIEADLDASKLKSNTCTIEWPPRSGKHIEIPEIDRGEYFNFERARNKIHPAQIPLLEKLSELLN